MSRHLFTIILIFALIAQANAWGPIAHERFCEESVEDAWGASALPCLTDTIEYCNELKEEVGEAIGNACLDAYASGVAVTPMNAPDILFQDSEKHYNYDDCPLNWVRPSKSWICAGEGNPALDEANKWFRKSTSADGACTQARLFCTGAYYYTSSYYPLLRVKHLSGCFGGPPHIEADEKILEGETDWEVKSQCVFQYNQPYAGRTKQVTQHISFIVSDEDYNSALGNLSVQAQYVRNPSLLATTTTQTTTTTTQSTTTTLPPTTTTIVKKLDFTTTTIATTTTTTTSTTTTSTSYTTTSTIPTTTTQPPKKKDEKLEKSIEEIDEIFNEIEKKVDKRKTSETGIPKSSITTLIVAALGIFIAIVLLVHLYTVMKRPHFHSRRKVIIPPSVRRRMRKEGGWN
jgi:hypothetical protein